MTRRDVGRRLRRQRRRRVARAEGAYDGWAAPGACARDGVRAGDALCDLRERAKLQVMTASKYEPNVIEAYCSSSSSC